MMIKKISDWTFQRKISFNPDVSKQLQENIFSQKIKAIKTDLSLVPNNINVSQINSQKSLEVS